MAQISAILHTTDSEFRSTITRLLRSSGLSIGLADGHSAGAGAPDLAIVDMRSGPSSAVDAIERMRGAWTSTAIFAVAASAEPDQILRAMRAGANEYLSWPQGENPSTLDEPFQQALKRTVERNKPSRDAARTAVTMSFFGAKGGAGTTTLAVNSAIEIARMS